MAIYVVRNTPAKSGLKVGPCKTVPGPRAGPQIALKYNSLNKPRIVVNYTYIATQYRLDRKREFLCTIYSSILNVYILLGLF